LEVSPRSLCSLFHFFGDAGLFFWLLGALKFLVLTEKSSQEPVALSSLSGTRSWVGKWSRRTPCPLKVFFPFSLQLIRFGISAIAQVTFFHFRISALLNVPPRELFPKRFGPAEGQAEESLPPSFDLQSPIQNAGGIFPLMRLPS